MAASGAVSKSEVADGEYGRVDCGFIVVLQDSEKGPYKRVTGKGLRDRRTKINFRTCGISDSEDAGQNDEKNCGRPVGAA